MALLGANGAGKSTTLKAISNLLRTERGEVTKGQIQCRGERVDGLTPNDLVRRGVIQVMEGRHCFGHLTVEENLLTGAFIHGSKRRQIADDLEKVYHYFPRLQGAPHQPGRLHLGRRAADDGDRPRADEPAHHHPARRAVDGPGAAARRGDLRDRQEPQRAARRSRSCWPSRTPTWRCATPITATSWRTAASCSTATPPALRENEDVKEFYLGIGGEGRRSFRDVKHYRRRKRWL